jgi:hypothetical protein
MTSFEAAHFGLEKNEQQESHPFENIEGFLRLPAEMQTQLKKIPMEQVAILLPMVKQKILALRETTEGTKEKIITADKKDETSLKVEVINGKIINKDNAQFYAEQLASIGKNLSEFEIENATAQIETVNKKEVSGRIVIAKNTPPLSVNLIGSPEEILKNTREIALQDTILSKLSDIFNGISDSAFKKIDMKSLVSMLYLIDDHQTKSPPFETPSFSLKAEKIFIALAKYSNFEFDRVFALFFDESGKLNERKFTAWLKLNKDELYTTDEINIAKLRFNLQSLA